jgi:hypothetical protein
MKGVIAVLILTVSSMSVVALASDDGKGNLSSSCDGTATFVYVPPGVDRQKFLADYVRTHKGPSDAELKACDLTRDKWRTEVLKTN